MTPEELRQLSKEELIERCLRQEERIAALEAENQAYRERLTSLEQKLAELEEKTKRPKKTPTNSSLPPSQGKKANRSAKNRGKRARKDREGNARTLHPDPDRTVEARPERCPGCGSAVSAEAMKLAQRYDRIELPEIRPDVTRVHQFQAVCPCCGEQAVGEPPEGLEPGSPFGKSIQAVIIHLHAVHAISFARIATLMNDLFGVTISEGGIANLFQRNQARFAEETATITEELRNSDVIASDETGTRVKGSNWWNWVFNSATAVRHHIAERRSKDVVGEVLGDHAPRVWVSDRFPAQKGHGEAWQVCLAHMLRDVQYAIDSGDTTLAPQLRDILRQAVTYGWRRDKLKDSTLAQYRSRLERNLDDALTRPPDTQAAERLRRQVMKVRPHLFVFLTDRAVPATNNASERYLRPAVVFRKVTHCFRAPWGAQFYATVRSVIDTGGLHGFSALGAIRQVLHGRSVIAPAAA